MKTGTEAAVYAAEASDTNDLLERVLPETVDEYVEFVKAHIAAGNKQFTFSIGFPIYIELLQQVIVSFQDQIVVLHPDNYFCLVR